MAASHPEPTFSLGCHLLGFDHFSASAAQEAQRGQLAGREALQSELGCDEGEASDDRSKRRQNSVVKPHPARPEPPDRVITGPAAAARALRAPNRG
jgi:hypothetical protein